MALRSPTFKARDRIGKHDILPVGFGLPFGCSVIFPPNLPLPAKVATEVLEAIAVTARLGNDPGVDELRSAAGVPAQVASTASSAE